MVPWLIQIGTVNGLRSRALLGSNPRGTTKQGYIMRELFQVLRYVKANKNNYSKSTKLVDGMEDKISFVLASLAIAYNIPTIDVVNLYAEVKD